MRSAHGFLCVICLAVLPCVNDGSRPDDPWKKAGANAGLRHAFEQAIYSINPSGQGAYQGENPAQNLGLEFTTGEVRLNIPGANIGLRLIGYGYGERLLTPAPAKLAGAGTRVEYQRDGITEWYANESRGLEQGFTLTHRPDTARKDEPLVIALRVSGGLCPVLSAEGDAALLQADEQAVLRYAGLHARDADGREVPSHLEVREREIRLVIEDRRAVYPLVVDPMMTWIQQAELTASDGVVADEFGTSVAVSGSTAVVGTGPYLGLPGAAYVFVQIGGTWTQQAKLAASGGEFGTSVAVSGSTVVVGAPNDGSVHQGAAYVFVQSGTTWTQQAELKAGDGVIGDFFGGSVSVSGGVAVIGAYNHTVGGSAEYQGVAYVFVRSGTTWSQQAELTSSDGATMDFFGYSVAVSGSTAVVGVGSSAKNAAYVFVQSGSAWTQQAKLTAAGSGSFGYSVAVSGDTALVGAYGTNVNSNISQGAAYMFVRSGTSWSQQAELVSSDGTAGDQFGVSVAVSGGTAVVGADNKTVNFSAGQGEAYVFQRSGSTWTEQQELFASDGVASDNFGLSVAVDSLTAVAGAIKLFSAKQGAAYVFAGSAATTSLSAHPNPAVFGSLVTLNAVVSPSSATGNVTFYDGTTVLGVAPISAGLATFSTTLLAAGSRSLTARVEAGSLSAIYPESVNAQAAIGFAAPASYPAGSYLPSWVATADFNGDGHTDLAIADEEWVTVLLGNGSGSFTATAGSPISAGGVPTSVAAGDFNGDGKPDLAVVDYNGGGVTILLGDGSGGFVKAGGSPFPASSFPRTAAVADFNGDGIADLAVASDLNGEATILLGNGSGGFRAFERPVATGQSTTSIAVGDFNGDGIADLAATNSAGVAILLGDGLGGFTAVSGSPFPAGMSPASVAVGDFNADGKLDLAVANETSNDVTILLGNGSGGFTAAGGSPAPAGTGPSSVAVGDFNGDGKPDLAVADFGATNVTLLLGNGSGGFTPASGSPFGAGFGPISVAVGDFNGDGRADLAVANQSGAEVTVLLGVADTATQLKITQQPSSGLAGAPIANVVVQVQDGAGNLFTGSTAAVTIASSPAGVNGTLTVNAVGGVATFSNLVFSAANTYTLTASAAGLTSATSAPLQIASTATKLKITQQPSSGLVGAPIANVVVQVQDAAGNLVAGSTAAVSIASSPAGVNGTLTVNAVGGVATFSNLMFSAANTYTITASATGLTSAISAPIQIASTATKLKITQQPSSGLVGAPIANVLVQVQDAAGNLVAGSTAAVTISSAPAGVVGTLTVNAVGGVATFSNLMFGAANTYTLTTSAAGLTSATSTPIQITLAGMSISQTILNFGSGGGSITDPQFSTVSFAGSARAAWTASSNQANVHVTPASGTGLGTLTITATAGPSATVTVTAPGVPNSPLAITVNVATVTPGNPFGSFDTPVNGAAVSGSIAVTGWALDSIEVTGLNIMREPVAGEPASPPLILVGAATFVVGARPDVQALYPTTPFNYRAGWGYLLLTNELPNNGGAAGPGNGTYKLHAVATNKTGVVLDLGTKTITVNNAAATLPFGAIDTPGQGATVSGTVTNFGWALTPPTAGCPAADQPCIIPITGATIFVYVDGVALGNPVYNLARCDVDQLFPGYANSGSPNCALNGTSPGPVGYFNLDTTTLANGVHTIAWSVTDNAGRAQGIGSRYFTVEN